MAGKITSIARETATEQQLRDYAMNFLQLELAPGDDPLAAISRAEPNSDRIFIMEAPAEPTGPAPVAADRGEGTQGSLGRGDPRCTINIPMVESDDNSGKSDVVVGVNGRAWQIKRGVDVTVPLRVALALDGALTTIIRHDDDGNVESRDAKRFPYQRVGDWPSDAEIDAWNERVSGEFCA